MAAEIDLTGPTKPPTPLEAYRTSTLNLPGVTREDYWAFTAGPATVPPTEPAANATGPGLGTMLLIALALLWVTA